MRQLKLIVPPAQLDVPEKVCNRLFLANAGNYYPKQDHFYPLKNYILFLYGHEDGFDIQTLKRKCHTCKGTGNFLYWKHDDFEMCWNCTNGIYKTGSIALRRFLLNDHVFHVPDRWLDVSKIHSIHIKNHIHELIKHPAVDTHTAFRCFISLYYHYYREKFHMFMYSHKNCFSHHHEKLSLNNLYKILLKRGQFPIEPDLPF